MQDFQCNKFTMSTSTETFKEDLLSLKLKYKIVRLEMLNEKSYQICNPMTNTIFSMFDEGFDMLKAPINWGKE